MATAVDICNLALSRAKADTIGSFDEGSAESIQCNILYELTRDHLLTAFAWPFAKTTRALSLQSNTPDEWQYAYDYPNDCLRVHYILPPNSSTGVVSGSGIAVPNIEVDPVPYEIATGNNGSRQIWTNLEDAYIAYTKKVTDTRLFDPLFVQALAWNLTAELAIPLGGDSGKYYRDTAMRMFNETIGQAAAYAANENEQGRQRLPRSITVRNGGIDSHYFYDNLAYRRY